MDLKHKIGPLPVWAWGLIFGVAGYFLYERYKASSSGSSSSSAGTTGILDPNAVDPNTGLTYGQEEAAALNANAGSIGGGSGGGGIVTPTDSGAQSTVTPTNEFGDFLGFLGQWNQFAQAMGWTPPGTVSDTTAAAASSPPVQGSSPPTSTPAANTTSIIDTHPGGPFYNWYTSVYGKPPPAHVASSAPAYLAWKAGVPKSILQTAAHTGKKAAGTAAHHGRTAVNLATNSTGRAVQNAGRATTQPSTKRGTSHKPPKKPKPHPGRRR